MKTIRLALLLAATAACGGGGDDAAPASPPAPEILAPLDGAEVAGPDVRIMLGANVAIVPAGTDQPNSGHHHLMIDADLTPEDEPIPAGPGIVHLGAAQTEHVIEGLAPGEHTIIARLGNYLHVPLPGARTDTVRITVR